jgi:outer membrane protein TolC
VAANQKIKVSTAILELAELVAKISGQQAESGDLAKIYVTEAEEDVERRNADLAQSQRDFQRYSFRLSAMLFDVGGVPLPLPTEQNVPEAMPRPQMMMAEEQDRNVIKALATRPELKAIDLQKKIAQAQLKLAENQLLPAMNAVVVGGYDNGKNGIHKVYRGQVTFSQPLLMRTAKGKVQAAKLRLDKLGRDRQAEEQRIRNEVYDAISAINLSYTKFLALEKQVQKSQQVYFGERERFQVGDSTVFLVSERERQLNEAKFRLIDAQVEFQVGLLALKAITTQL